MAGRGGGVGGRLDETSAADASLSVVARFALADQEQLGASLAAIAAEKAGVFRAATPALAWGEEPESTTALQAAAHASGAQLALAVEEVSIAGWQADGLAGQRLELRTSAGEHRLLLPLAGAHQRRNA